MIVRTLVAAAALFLPAALALADGDFTRTLSVSSSPDLTITTGSGSVRIHAGTGDRIEIRAHLHAAHSLSPGDVQARLAQILADPPISQTGNTVRIGSVNNRPDDRDIVIDYEIAAPRASALTLTTGSGDIEVNQVGRSLVASAASGSIRAHGLAGPAQLRTGSGDVELDEAANGQVSAKTGSGSIRVRGLDGGIDGVTGSGDIEVQGHLAAASRLTSGAGSVRLHLTPNSRFDLSAATGMGNVRVHLPGATAPSPSHRWSGPVNGGGPAVTLHTGIGDIELTTS